MEVRLPDVQVFRRGVLASAQLLLQFTSEILSQTETAGFGNIFGHLVHNHVTVDGVTARIPSVFGLEHRLLAFSEDLPQQDRLERTTDFRNFVGFRDLFAGRKAVQREVASFNPLRMEWLDVHISE